MTETTDLCVRCKYDLRGIGNDQPCPECGLLAERSRHLTERLRDTDPGYLRRLNAGVWLLIIVPVLLVGWLFVLGMLEMARMTGGLSPHLIVSGMTAAASVLVLGVWLLTSADRTHRAGHLPWSIRYLSLLPLLCTVMVHAQIELLDPAGVFGMTNYEMVEALSEFSLVLIWAWLIVFPVLFFMQLRGIARRLISAHMMEHSAIVGIGWSVSTSLLLAIILLTAYAEELNLGWQFAARSNVWLIWMVIVISAVALFSLWTVYLLIRFAIAFLIESYALRKLWREADRSGFTSPPG